MKGANIGGFKKVADAMLALGVQPGDAVVVPSVTFLASANCVAYVGADVAFADEIPAEPRLVDHQSGLAVSP